MRRTASEVLRNLEVRVAHLEKSAWGDTPADYYSDKIAEKHREEILSHFGGVLATSGDLGYSNEPANARVYELGPVDFSSSDSEIEIELLINLFEGEIIRVPMKHIETGIDTNVKTHADTLEARRGVEKNLSSLKRLMSSMGYVFQSFSLPETVKLDRRTHKVYNWPEGATHFFGYRACRVLFTYDVDQFEEEIEEVKPKDKFDLWYDVHSSMRREIEKTFGDRYTGNLDTKRWQRVPKSGIVEDREDDPIMHSEMIINLFDFDNMITLSDKRRIRYYAYGDTPEDRAILRKNLSVAKRLIEKHGFKIKSVTLPESEKLPRGMGRLTPSAAKKYFLTYGVVFQLSLDTSDL